MRTSAKTKKKSSAAKKTATGLVKKTSNGLEWLVNQGASWLNSDHIRPYIYLREENRFKKPGSYIKNCDWFQAEPLYVNPLKMSEVAFADQILNLESKAFQKSAMPMPRWVFYDCAVMPGFVCGFAQRTNTLSKDVIDRIGIDVNQEWTPISLFIIIPTLRQGEWVAHNLCTMNSLVDEKDRLYALGYLSKAFGIWYANVEILCGMTQWNSPALRLHSHYGDFEVLTAYTPVHSYAQTMTYRSEINFKNWPLFFLEEEELRLAKHNASKIITTIDRENENSMKSLQTKIEMGDGPFYLNSAEIRERPLNASLNVYKKLS